MESPFVQKLGFRKLIHNIEKQTSSANQITADRANHVIKNLKHKKDLIEGIYEHEKSKKYDDDICLLMNQLFPPSLLSNEIKLATSPFNKSVLFRSHRFIDIFGRDGNVDFVGSDAFASAKDKYILSCAWIIKSFYDTSLHFGSSQFCNLRDKQGMLRHYRALINAEFYEIEPIGEKPDLSPEIIQTLLHNGNNLELWQEYFPPNSWVLNGFGIVNLFDATRDQALSHFKDLLIVKNKSNKDLDTMDEIEDVLRSYLQIPDLKTDLLLYDRLNDHLSTMDQTTPCLGLSTEIKSNTDDLFCINSKDQLFTKNKSLVLSDIPTLLENGATLGILKGLADAGFKSYMAIPIVDEDKVMGILEFGSKELFSFNSIVEQNIRQIIPIVESSVKGFIDGQSNLLSAIIQHECTAIHPSVEWKFYDEANRFLTQQIDGGDASFEEIVLKDLYALYGQIDISGSSVARNNAIANDLSNQLSYILALLEKAEAKVPMPLISSVRFQCNILIEQINSDLASGIEQEVIAFIKENVHPILREIQSIKKEFDADIKDYFDLLHPELGIIYKYRKDYDKSLEIIGKTMAASIDKKQKSAQEIFPHYFERYKTDGVEHNMFIGQEISPTKEFKPLHLRNLHLWQLKAMCEMEREHQLLKKELPLPLDVASLIMVYSTPLSIRYRLDEKHFDIDGAYNARYEIIKKRIDKAYIKGTTERITQPGKMVIVFTQQAELEEYRSHINFLIYEGLLKNDLEIVELQNLQGVIGLKAIRVSLAFEEELSTHSKKVKEKGKSKQTS